MRSRADPRLSTALLIFDLALIGHRDNRLLLIFQNFDFQFHQFLVVLTVELINLRHAAE